MLNIIVKEHLELNVKETKLITFIKENLIIDNPDYIKLIRLKKWVGRTPAKLYLYEQNENTFILPYGFKYRLERFLQANDIKYQLIDMTATNPLKMVKTNNLSLYDYQKQAVEQVLKHTNGILVSPAGSGKTRMAMKLIGELNQKTLWLTNNLSLLTQSKNVFKEFYGNKVGEISGGKVNIQDITFATVQTMANLDLTKYTNEFGLVITDECFSGDVEILTEKGFIRFDKLQDEMVAQYEEDGTIKFVKPIRKIQHKHNGDMIKYHLHRNSDVLMTPNHTQIFKHNNGNIIKVLAKDIKYGRLIVSGKGTGESNSLTAFEKLLILTQADGYKTHAATNQYQLSLAKERKVERFFEIIKELDIDIRLKEIKKYKNKRRFTYYLPQGVEPKLLSNVFDIKDFNYNKAREFIDEVCLWDGYRKDGKNINYDSKIKENVDLVAAIATLGGYKNYTVRKVDNRKETFSDIYRVFFLDQEEKSVSIQRQKIETVNYNGNVYCVEVPSNMIVVRSKGTTFISGNCHRVIGSPTKMQQFYKVINSLNAKYKYGLTATLFEKKNDMSMCPIFLIGEKLHEVKTENVEKILAEHHLYKLDTPFSYDILNADRTIDYNKLLDYLVNNPERNTQIMINLFYCQDKHNIILTSRNEHINILSEYLNSFDIPHHIVIGDTKIQDRVRMYEDFKQGKVRFLLSNYQLAKEGLDLPIADTLHLVTPIRDKRSIIQSAGRVERKHVGKTESKVYDYVDVEFPMLVNMYKDRKRYLNAR